MFMKSQAEVRETTNQRETHKSSFVTLVTFGKEVKTTSFHFQSLSQCAIRPHAHHASLLANLHFSPDERQWAKAESQHILGKKKKASFVVIDLQSKTPVC